MPDLGVDTAKPVDWIVNRLHKDLRREGVMVIHAKSGRIFLHKHGYDAPVTRASATFSLATIHGRIAAQEHITRIRLMHSPTHILAYQDGLDCTLIAIKHYSNHWDANNACIVVADNIYGKCVGPYRGHELSNATTFLAKPRQPKREKRVKVRLEHKPMHAAWGLLD